MMKPTITYKVPTWSRDEYPVRIYPLRTLSCKHMAQREMTSLTSPTGWQYDHSLHSKLIIVF